MKISLAIKLTGIGIAGAAPLAALAQSNPTLPGTDIKTIGDVLKIVCSLVNWLFAVLVLLTIIFVIVAAFRYLTASGEPEKITKANKTIIYAAVAIAVALLSRMVPVIVADLLHVQVSGGTFFFIWASCL